MSDASTIKKYTSVFSCSSTISEANVRSVGRTLDVVTCSRSVRDLDDDAPRQVSEVLVATHGLNSEYTTPLELLSSTPVLKKAALTSLSPSGKRTFVGTAAGDDGDTPILMVNGGATGNDLLLKVDASTVHGKVMADMHFGGVSWSADERYVAYVAKPKEAKLGTPFDAGDAIDKDKAKDKKPDEGQARGEDRYKFDYVEDWGEKNVGLSSTVIAVLDTVSGSVQVVVPRGPATDTTVGQPLLLPTQHGSMGPQPLRSRMQLVRGEPRGHAQEGFPSLRRPRGPPTTDRPFPSSSIQWEDESVPCGPPTILRRVVWREGWSGLPSRASTLPPLVPSVRHPEV